jgi:hypothetical protein
MAEIDALVTVTARFASAAGGPETLISSRCRPPLYPARNLILIPFRALLSPIEW